MIVQLLDKQGWLPIGYDSFDDTDSDDFTAIFDGKGLCYT